MANATYMYLFQVLNCIRESEAKPFDMPEFEKGVTRNIATEKP